jgi:hypothetical protein
MTVVPTTIIPTPSPTSTPTPVFVATGNMNQARAYATATLLADGRVLVAGGAVTLGLTETDVASAELYDPGTGKFTPTGLMTTPRAYQTATLLLDGRVLVAGGYGCVMSQCTGSTLTSAELYDPSTGKFSRTESVPIDYEIDNATLLIDGNVLLVGGKAGTTAVLYDPTSGKFVRTGSSLIDMGYGGDTVIRLANGRVLMIGKTFEGPRAEIYDPATGKFTAIPFGPPPGPAASAQFDGTPVKRTAPDTATLLKDGRVLLFENGFLETYDPTTGMFTPAGFMYAPGQWYSPAATLLRDGRVLFEGGDFVADLSTLEGAAAPQAALFDPADGPQLIGSLQTPRLGQTATLLPDGSVLVTGGTADGTNALASTELFR